MILERAIFDIKPGHGEQFIAAFAEARKLISASPGFQRLEMRRGIETPDGFLLLVWWDDVDAHMVGFRGSPAFVTWRALLSPHFVAPPAMEHYADTL